MPKAGALLNATRDEAVEHLVGRTSVDLQGRPGSGRTTLVAAITDLVNQIRAVVRELEVQLGKGGAK